MRQERLKHTRKFFRAGRRYSLACMRTTDPQDERFDVVDEHDNVIGVTTRGEAHRNPALMHRSIGILVFVDGKLLLQKRSLTKDTYPGYWTCSVAGHVDSGETYDQAAVRELREELGLQADAPLQALVTQVIRYPHETERMRFYRYDTTLQPTPDAVEMSDVRAVDPLQPLPKDMQPTPCLLWILEYLQRHSKDAA